MAAAASKGGNANDRDAKAEVECGGRTSFANGRRHFSCRSTNIMSSRSSGSEKQCPNYGPPHILVAVAEQGYWFDVLLSVYH